MKQAAHCSGLKDAVIVEAENHVNVEISACMLVIVSRGSPCFMAAVLNKAQAEQIVRALCAAHRIEQESRPVDYAATSD